MPIQDERVSDMLRGCAPLRGCTSTGATRWRGGALGSGRDIGTAVPDALRALPLVEETHTRGVAG